ncbi:MAG TPA: tetratricopeptide repeat protein [Methyloceanibacter sp.]|nr:tetratricopeptide repeat protein [Methyloceanibacter sp.]
MSELWDDLPETESFPHIQVKLSPRQYRERLAENPELGATWVRDAALSGLPEAQVGLGHILLDGYGVERDPVSAVRWFELAAQQDNPDAFNMLGRCHECGWGVAPDAVEAALWYERAAAKGHDWAQFNLACLILATQGWDAGLPRALSLLVASARAGNPKAKNMIGDLREKGWAGAPKLRSAALWYRWAAEGGCYRGQFHHARFLLRAGKIGEAKRWFRSSLRQAPPDFAGEARDILRGHHTERVRAIAEEQLGRSQERVA